MAQVKNYKDKYAEIGTMDIKATREDLVEQKPQVLPEVYLEAQGIDKEAIFTCTDKEMSKEQLEQASRFSAVYPARRKRKLHKN